MKWSYKIARFAGIDVSVHITFFLLLLWFAIMSWQQSQQIPAVVSSLAFIIVLFTCVLLHEFGHALTARHFGYRTRGITLLPIGGVASLEKMPDDPRQEILVALAGPAVNVVIAAALFVFLSMGSDMPSVDDIGDGNIPFLYQIMLINIVLALFNLLPAFPMDGGRVLRASFAFFMPHNQATQKAARIGQGFAILLMVTGFFYNPWMILIGVFIWFAATAEANMENIQTSLFDMNAGQAMISDFQTLDVNDDLQKAIDLTLQGSQKDFPVMMNKEARFLLSQKDLLGALQKHSSQVRLSELSLPEIHRIDASTPLNQIFTEFYQPQHSLAAVYHQGKMLGILNLDNLLELIQIHNALQTHKEKR